MLDLVLAGTFETGGLPLVRGLWDGA
ncbi:hypothetical protein SIAM614_06258 [Stappia aggregata IAM 12614]|uniref:Uncharacterized protein n=1 Tax=Roseibium aggregatum (strain ATCC 25650 / DSM 13394 / JCM 20685 / NBRC 16684 / NCIMB 2208 / IAM 12614 / B1) TaxID=384765 RepID=A0NV97_ROSAI|nr:hypothetical protein SIAM614_06258 [Stappia aggregata IAM 12614] [Roseibium aggregatum IAM 12614]